MLLLSGNTISSYFDSAISVVMQLFSLQHTLQNSIFHVYYNKALPFPCREKLEELAATAAADKAADAVKRRFDAT